VAGQRADASEERTDVARIWDYVLQKLQNVLESWSRCAKVINHKMMHIRKARIEQKMREP